MEIQAIGFIPARFGSTRFPGKPLVEIKGKPLIQWVWEASCQSNLLRRIIIATDDDRIAESCMDMGAEYIMTPSNLKSGTDRILHAYKLLEEESDYILNIQGDEPLINGLVIDKLLYSINTAKTETATLVKKINSYEELIDPSVVKVVMKKDNKAIYFSRNPIPFVRDVEQKDWLKHHSFWKHIGIYCYRSEVLRNFNTLSESDLEDSEKLEQLRLLENGSEILCVETNIDFIGIDTPQDIDKLLSKNF